MMQQRARPTNADRLPLRPFLYLWAALGGLHLMTTYIDLYHPSASAARLATWFGLDHEYNIPTAVIALLMLACALACLRLVMLTRVPQLRSFWICFALLFTYFAADEWLVIHERLAEPIRDLLTITEGPLFHAWVIPVIAIIAVSAVAYLIIRRRQIKLLYRYNRLYLYLLMLAGGIVLLEIAGTFVYDNQAAYRLGAVFVEEMYELGMTGLIFATLYGYGAGRRLSPARL